MRAYAEQTWGSGTARRSRSPFDKIVQLEGRDIGLLGVARTRYWFLDKLYLLPPYQNQGLGAACCNVDR